MARFQIEKGERFSLSKSEGLEKVRVDLNWKSGADLDASAFLIGEDGLISDDADFVFYNSKNRAIQKRATLSHLTKPSMATRKIGRTTPFLFQLTVQSLAPLMTSVMMRRMEKMRVRLCT